jgi:hypothetical protein
MRSIYSIKSNDRGLLSTARRFNGIYNPSKKTFSCDLKTRSRDESARLPAKNLLFTAFEIYLKKRENKKAQALQHKVDFCLV